MTMLSIVCTKLFCTNTHLGRRVADHHFKVYIRGSRNGIAILDSDKTLICLRNALHFIGSPSRQKGRSFFLKTNQIFYLEIMEEMAIHLRSNLQNVNSHCFDDSQWKIGAFLTNSFANKKKFRSIKKKIHFGLNQQPDCVVILNADRKSSVILEADRSQIPIPSLGDSMIPWESFKRITYTIPANDPIQFVYLFCHSIMKTVIINKNKRNFCEGNNALVKLNLRFFSSSPRNQPKSKKGFWNSIAFFAAVLVLAAFGVFFKVDLSWIPPDQAVEFCMSLSQSLYHTIRPLFKHILTQILLLLGEERSAPLGGTGVENPTPSRSEEDPGGVQIFHSERDPRFMKLNDVNYEPRTPKFFDQLAEADLRWKELQEQKSKDTLLTQMQELYGGTDEEAARKDVIKQIADKNQWFLSQLSSHMPNRQAPLVNKIFTEKDEWELYETCVKKLVSHQGKPFNLTSLVDLKVDLENDSKKNEIVNSFFDKYGKKSKKK